MEVQNLLDNKKNKKKSKLYTPNGKEMANLRPEDFEVPQALCLNLKTLDSSFCAPDGFDNF